MNEMDKFVLSHSVSRPLTSPELENVSKLLRRTSIDHGTVPAFCVILYSYCIQTNTLLVSVAHEPESFANPGVGRKMEKRHQFKSRCKMAAIGSLNMMVMHKPKKMQVAYAIAV